MREVPGSTPGRALFEMSIFPFSYDISHCERWRPSKYLDAVSEKENNRGLLSDKTKAKASKTTPAST